MPFGAPRGKKARGNRRQANKETNNKRKKGTWVLFAYQGGGPEGGGRVGGGVGKRSGFAKETGERRGRWKYNPGPGGRGQHEWRAEKKRWANLVGKTDPPKVDR